MADSLAVTNTKVSMTGNTTNNALKDFALSGDINSKKSEKFGAEIILQCEKIITSGYFTERNKRFLRNNELTNGTIDIQTTFQDLLNMDGKGVNYVKLIYKSIMIVNTIASRIVGRFMTIKQKASVKAIDMLSVGQKNEQISQAEYLLYNKDALLDLQQHSGVKVIPDNSFIPDDKDDLDLWAKEELRIPEEILYEEGINNIFDKSDYGFMGLNTRKTKHDAVVSGLVCSEVVCDKHGKIKIYHHKPENCFYSYSEYDDFRDSSIKGVVKSLKITEIRDLYPKLTMIELMEIAKFSQEWQASDKINYNTTAWSGNSNLPIDDWSVDVVSFTLKTLDKDMTLVKNSKDGKTYIEKKDRPVTDVYPTNEYIEKKIWNIYRGVYIRGNKMILEWGLEKNMIKPQDYEKIGDAHSPFSFNMPQNNKMRNLAIPEKVESPALMMIFFLLRIQHMVAKLQLPGHIYDIDGLQEIDLGNGVVKPLELRRVTDQTGDIFFRSKDAEGNRIETPIRENPNTGGIQQLEALISAYNFQYQVLRDQIGSNEVAEGQSVKPRVGQQNVQASLQISFNAMDYINDACVSMDQENSYKIGCLLHDSVEFGSKEYRMILKEQDVKDREFDIRIDMLPDDQKIGDFNASINAMMQAQPDLILYLNPEKLKRIAEENVKLAEQFLRQGQRRALIGKEKQSAQQSKMNADNQQQAGIAVEKEKQNSIQIEISMKTQLETILSNNKQKEAILHLFAGIYAKGLPVPDNLKQLEAELIQNLGLPLLANNIQTEQQMQQAGQQQPQQGQQQQQGQAQPQGQPQGQPQEDSQTQQAQELQPQ